MGLFQYGGIVEQIAITATAAGTTTLTNVSKQLQVFTGSTTQTIVLPDATSYTAPGTKFEIYNQSSGTLTLQFNGGASFTDAAGISYGSLAANTSLILKLQSNGTSAGSWAVTSGGSGSGSLNINASYYVSASTQTPGTNAQFNFDTEVFDTNSAVTTGTGTWKFTAPVDGVYQISAHIVYVSGAVGNCFLYKNGASYARFAGTYSGVAGANTDVNDSALIKLVTGDFIDLRPNNGATFTGGNAPMATYINIARIGS